MYQIYKKKDSFLSAYFFVVVVDSIRVDAAMHVSCHCILLRHFFWLFSWETLWRNGAINLLFYNVKRECRPQKQVINPNECLGMARSIKDAQNLQGFHVFSWLLPISSLCARLRKGRYRNIKTACSQPASAPSRPCQQPVRYWHERCTPAQHTQHSHR